MKKTSSNSKSVINRWMKAFPFIAVGLLLMALFILYPLIHSVLISFTDYNVISNSVNKYVGLDNYKNLIKDGNFLIAFRNSILYTLITVPGQIFFGLILACLIHSVKKGKTVFKVICYLPVITSWVVVALIFKYLFTSGNGGLINYILLQLHIISEPVSWLQNEWTANIVLWLFGIWKGVGWVMIIYMAGLQDVPKEIYEAAQIDGANRIKTFFKITIPLLKNTTSYLITVLTIGAFGAYIHVMMITDGAPLGRTNQLMNYMYNSAFSSYDFGSASAQAVVMGVIVVVLTLIPKIFSRTQKN